MSHKSGAKFLKHTLQTIDTTILFCQKFLSERQKLRKSRQISVTEHNESNEMEEHNVMELKNLWKYVFYV